MIKKIGTAARPQWYTFTYISLMLAMIYILLPTVRSHLPSIVNQFIMLAFTGLSFLGVIMQKGWHKSGKIAALISVIILIIVIYFGKWKLIDSSTNQGVISRMFSLYEFWIFWVISKNTVKFSDNDKRKILNYYLIMIAITSVTTIIGCSRYTMASRFLAGAATSYEYALYRGLNIGGYEFIYGITLAVPFLVYLIYKPGSKISKLFYIASIIMIFAVIIISQYATALVLAAAAIIFSIIVLFMNSTTGKIFMIAALGIFVVLLLSGAFVQLLYWARDMLLNYNLRVVSLRIDEIIKFIQNNSWSGSSELREYLRMQSLEVFMDNPLCGCLFKPQALGGHSEILDIMGAGGILGVILFTISLVSHYNMVKSSNKDALFKTIFLGTFAIFIALAYINTLFTSPDIALSFFVIPTLIIRENRNNITLA